MIFRGLMWLAGELRDRAENELYDEEGIHQELADAYRQLETRAITEEQFAQIETQLMARLEVVQAHIAARKASAEASAAEGAATGKRTPSRSRPRRAPQGGGSA